MTDESTSEREQAKGQVERLLARMYERFGSRIVLVAVVAGYAYGVLSMVMVFVAGGRYLGLSTPQALSLWPVAPIELGLGIAGLVPVAGQIRTLLAWSGDGRTRERAGVTWHCLVRYRRVVTSVVSAVALGVPPAAVVIIVHFHRPWYGVPTAIVAIAVVLGGIWTVTAFSADLVLRPMIEDVAAHLPASFQPQTSGMRLRTKAAATLPIVTFWAALIVGAYANLLPNGTQRAVLAIGVSLATVVVATAIFVIINRSVLSPIDDLIAATERVSAGDITTPVPLVTDDELGTLALGFNRMLADLQHHTEEIRASRERIVTTADEERRRMERDLHDGAQQLIVLAQLKLGVIDRAIESDPGAARAATAELRHDLARALTELRDLARGIYPALLQNEGLAAALGEAAARAPIPVEVECDGAGRYRSELEAAVYFCCLEALQNAAKHAGDGTRATVRLGDQGNELRFEVADDGCGYTANGSTPGAGLLNMADRIGAIGGELRIDSTPGHGTTVVGTVPLGPS